MIIEIWKRYSKTIFDMVILLITAYLFMWILSYLYKIATPIFLSFIIYWIVKPAIQFLVRLGLKRNFAVLLAMFGFIALLVLVFVFIGTIFTAQILILANKIGMYQTTFQQELIHQIATMQGRIKSLPPDVLDKVKEYTSILTQHLTESVRVILQYIINVTTSFSVFIINLLLAIILAYFLSLEAEFWHRFYRDKAPNTVKLILQFLRESVLTGIGKYIGATIKITILYSVLIWICLLLLSVNNSLSISIIAGISGNIPVVGTGIIFIPWIIYLFIVGNISMAIWILVIFIGSNVLKHILEPKIIGNTLGVSAFTMLSFMIISLELFGVAGVILAPFIVIILKALYQRGILQQWVRIPDDF